MVEKCTKRIGVSIKAAEPLLELETDKVTLEVFAPAAGTLSEIRVDAGGTVEVGAVLGVIGDGAATSAAKPAAKEAPRAPAKEAPKPAAAAEPLAPAVRKLLEENRLDPKEIAASGKDGRLTKGDVLAFLEARGKTTITPAAPAPTPAASPPASPAPAAPAAARPAGAR